ncbi:MAG: hypothetical protein A2Y25_03830 [Candidatus Melainabacteria bacterium GWF2_37_15]|nr:MAG: hypothetical protein A2Y25_03830 [Candidatus Melainabacteria bacterium GWF2_37_15]
MKTLFIFANPEFDQRSQCGISKLYQIFSKKYGFNIEIINEEFLRTNVPEDDSSQILVIAGGDGTIHRVLNTIPEKVLERYHFGIIPGGTANEFVKSLRLPLWLEQAAEIIAASPNVVCQTPGLINKKYRFATGFLYGIAYKVLQETSPVAKQYFGPYAYQLPGLFSLANYADFVKSFRVDSMKFRTGYLLINNASLISKDLFPNEIKNEDPTLFSIVYLHAPLFVGDFIRLIIKNQRGAYILEDPALFYRQIGDFTLEFEGDLDFMLDGEIYKMSSPIRFQHSKYNFKVIV